MLSGSTGNQQSGDQTDSLSMRQVAELFHVSWHLAAVACALAGVIPRRVGKSYAVRRNDLDLLGAVIGREFPGVR